MGTRGLRIVRYRGRYWCFYNHWASYLEGMGNSLVESIPTNLDEYKDWLQAMRERFAKWDHLLQNILCIQPDRISHITCDQTVSEVLNEAFDARLEEFPTSDPGSLDLNIEYTYTYDLDQEVFSVDNTAHFRLQHIPRNSAWIEALCEDETSRRFVHPRLAPEESLASLACDNHSFSLKDDEYWTSLATRKVATKANCTSVSSELRLKLFDFLEDCQTPNLRVTLLSWTANDLLFRELAFFILCLAAGGDYLRIVDERRILFPPRINLYGAIDHGKGSEGERELISSIGNGFHLNGQPMGSAPSTSKYWFEGALVCLVPRLDQDHVMEKAIADAVRYGREECGRTSFNAVLISISNLVLLRSFPDGRVEHSPNMALLSTTGSSGLNAEQRYGKAWLDDFYGHEMARRRDAKRAAAEKTAKEKNGQGSDGSAVLASWHNSQDSTNQQTDCKVNDDSLSSTNKMEQEFSDMNLADVTGLAAADKLIQDNSEATGHAKAAQGAAKMHDDTLSETMIDVGWVKPPVPPAQTEPTSASSAQSHEDADEGSGVIPDDDHDADGEEKHVEEPTIMVDKAGEENVEDNIGTEGDIWETGSTFLALMSFLDATARETLKPTNGCKQLLPTEITEMILAFIFDLKTYNACMRVSRAFRGFCLRRPLLMDGVALLKVLPTSTETAKGELRLLAEHSTGQQLVISIEKGHYYSNNTSLYRFVAGKEWNRMSFCPRTRITIQGLNAPDPFDSVIREQPRRRDSWMDRRSKPGDSVWLQARQRHGYYGDIKSLGEFWESAAQLLLKDFARGFPDPVIQEPHGKAWLMPANTKQFSIYIHADDHKKYERLLILRIKRASQYWDCLWDDIIREVKEVLAGVDDDFALKRKKKTQSVGAANPAVILAVGLEVRLFEWNAEAATLTETIPDHAYCVMDEEDGNVVEAILSSAVERLRTAERKEKRGFNDEE
ncbi:MAG: hypothetical protein Q9177_002993 [Variospora cf. flavescens]